MINDVTMDSSIPYVSTMAAAAVPFEPRPLLWQLILEHLEEPEIEEIKLILGESLIDETLDLHGEVISLLEIWRQCREQTDEKKKECKMKVDVLPEPPAARERLKQEVLFFIENIRQKTLEDGRDLKIVLSRHNSKVIDYVMEAQQSISRDDISSRSSTACNSQDGRETPLRTTPQSDTTSQSSALSDEIEMVNTQLTVGDIHSVVNHLRTTLEEEAAQLRSDIQFLQRSIDEECEHFSNLTRERQPSPTLQELRECSNHLEKDFVSHISFPQPPVSQRKNHHVRQQKSHKQETWRPRPPAPNISMAVNYENRPNSVQKLRQMVLDARETV